MFAEDTTTGLRELADGTTTSLQELGFDALDVVVQNLAPRDVGRVMRTCRALAVAATPLHPSWEKLRFGVQTTGWWEEAYVSAAERGDVQAMRWVGAQGYDLESASGSAARGGHVPMLQWLYARLPNSAWDAWVFSEAAGSGLEAVQFLRAQTPPCDWDCLAFTQAAKGGHVNVLSWLRSQGCPMDGTAMCSTAASAGQLDVLQWCRAQMCPWDWTTALAAAKNGHLDVLTGLSLRAARGTTRMCATRPPGVARRRIAR